MEPVYRHGDHVLTFNWVQLKKGDVIVFKNEEKNFIKRIDKLDDGKVYVSGDNKLRISLISPIKQDQIIGKVILKY